MLLDNCIISVIEEVLIIAMIFHKISVVIRLLSLICLAALYCLLKIYCHIYLVLSILSHIFVVKMLF